ncbi:DNA-binding transcriptional regulator, MocR family, contains an aminotransferase domain [Friedmanniella luteola]|uniref:DNA-binding transcriptional regulator, MocR family, contains an aminotransferase domain n=1 Tax=Friedmanniella luteola TaxID=546871 RepID=A0A1H1U671_9ACTN|nr:PLP-dependent aminotransferase family protein [Friedmanniella luteola]SDS67831.1 DNA-binding transcriptional regulator, MocR family, contains an aminotransferase domain [Friedmanniella luteola]
MTTPFARRTSRVQPSAIRELLRLGDDPSVISFGGGYPDPAHFPTAELTSIFTDVLASGARTLQYTASVGLPRLREQIAARMTRDGTPCTADDVVITHGGQQGLDLTGKLMIDPGDVIATENPTFLGALLAFNPYEPDYAAVRTDDDGLDPAHLDEVLTRHPRAKLVYTVPDFQNPTGVSLSLERRHQLIDVANRHDVVVLEDSPYRDLRFDGDRLPTLASLDTEGRVIHLGSFSKILAPGLRLGWMMAPGPLLDRLALLKLAADTQSSTLNMAAVSTYLERHDLDAQIVRANASYRRKRDLTLATLDRLMPADVTCTRPRGGLFTWLTFPEGFDTGDFMRDTLLPRARVAYVPGATFFPTRQEPNHARLSYATLPEETLVHGLGLLAHHYAAAARAG